MSKLQLIGDTRSRAFRVKWMLEEIGEPYEHVQAGPHSPDALAWNVSGKIPSLVEEGEAVFDSTAIIQYLADSRGRFTPKARHAGTGAAGRLDEPAPGRVRRVPVGGRASQLRSAEGEADP